MPSVELGLLENAIDSLNEALVKYQEAKDGESKAYKFCVQHLSHFLELILKYYVTTAHPLLIYKNPFSKHFDSDSQTIGLFEAVNFLKNEGRDISERFEQDLRWLKRLRNRIEHYKFMMDVDQFDETVGRLMSAVVTFDEGHESIDLEDYVSEEQYELFHELADTYERALARAEAKVEEILAGLDPKEDNRSVYHCYDCDHDTMAPADDSETGYRCTFCKNEESEDIEVDCGLCGGQWPIWQMKLLDWADTGNYEYYCPYCLHDPAYRKDD